MFSDDKDFKQKIEIQKIFWSMGMWARIDIPIVIYEDDSQKEKMKRHFLTDIDVYGENIQNDFSLYKSIADCKSGKNIKVFERLFWLRGVKDYFGASQAYLVKKNISNNAKIFLPRLEINGIDNDILTEFGKIYHTDSLPMFSEKYYSELEIIISNYRDEYKKIYDYLVTRYWFTESNISMRVLLTMLGKREFYKKFDKNKKEHRYLLMETCTLFARTILACCRYTLRRDVIDIKQSVTEYIHGGVDELNLKLNMIRDFKTELKELLKESQIDDKVFVYPPYFEELVKLVAVILSQANDIKDIIRYMEIMGHEIVLETKFNFKECIGSSYSYVGHKLAKDIIVLYLKWNNIDSHFFDDLLLD